MMTSPLTAARPAPPCPPWCARGDHDPQASVHLGPQHAIRPGPPAGVRARVCAAAVQDGNPAGLGDGKPFVMLDGWAYLGPSAAARIEVREAGALAAVIEMLACASPDQHRALAEGIRRAAAGITGTRDCARCGDRIRPVPGGAWADTRDCQSCAGGVLAHEPARVTAGEAR